MFKINVSPCSATEDGKRRENEVCMILAGQTWLKKFSRNWLIFTVTLFTVGLSLILSLRDDELKERMEYDQIDLDTSTFNGFLKLTGSRYVLPHLWLPFLLTILSNLFLLYGIIKAKRNWLLLWTVYSILFYFFLLLLTPYLSYFNTDPLIMAISMCIVGVVFGNVIVSLSSIYEVYDVFEESLRDLCDNGFNGKKHANCDNKYTIHFTYRFTVIYAIGYTLVMSGNITQVLLLVGLACDLNGPMDYSCDADLKAFNLSELEICIAALMCIVLVYSNVMMKYALYPSHKKQRYYLLPWLVSFALLCVFQASLGVLIQLYRPITVVNVLLVISNYVSMILHCEMLCDVHRYYEIMGTMSEDFEIEESKSKLSAC